MESKKRKGTDTPPTVISLTDHDDIQDTPATKTLRQSDNVQNTNPKSNPQMQKSLRFKDLNDYYNHMCELQLQAARAALSPPDFAKIFPIPRHFSSTIKRPRNYKSFCDKQRDECFPPIPSAFAPLNGTDKKSKKSEEEQRPNISFADDRSNTVQIPKTSPPPVPPMPPLKSINSYIPIVPTIIPTTVPIVTKHVPSPETAKNRKKKIELQDKIDPSKEEFQKLYQEVGKIDPTSRKGMKVLVLGAGISGIAAARELAALGFSVHVIEARERIGGRIHTITSEELKQGCGIDIGGAFLHGIKGNPITKLCKALGETLYSTSNDCALYDIDGKKIADEIDGAMEKKFNYFLDSMDKQRNKSRHRTTRQFVRWKDEHRASDTSLPPSQPISQVANGDVSLGKTLNEILLQWQQKSGVISHSEWRVLNWHFANIEGPCGADLSMLSLNHWDQDDPYEFEGDHCLLQRGYGHLVNSLAQGLDIHLGCKVEKIDYASDKAKVVTNKGTFEADMVLVTAPLGILKSNMIQFSPQLPKDKRDSIKKLGYGLLNKLVLFFNKNFWDTNSDYIGYTSEIRGEFYLFISMTKIVGAPVLVAMISGQAAYTIENLSGEDVVGKAMSILQKIYGPSAVTPTRAVITRWGSDPYALGSFSYVSVGSSGSDYDVLAKPVDNKLFFAGEHTHRHHPSTVTGGYMSGIRAAYEMATQGIHKIVTMKNTDQIPSATISSAVNAIPLPPAPYGMQQH